MSKPIITTEGHVLMEGTTNRKELAAFYGMTEQKFRKELALAGVFLGTGRVLWAMHVKLVVDALGPPMMLIK